MMWETLYDEDLWGGWHMLAGSPGSNNDVKKLSYSPLMVKVTQGDWPPLGFWYTVNGEQVNLPYFLVDGIYPRYSILLSPHATPSTAQEKAFNWVQEGMRKDFQRLYAILTAGFHVALHPAGASFVPTLICTAMATSILHNMMTELPKKGRASLSRTG